ncbi:MAG: NAD-dependent epimerase/dehydratase family protein [Steroidobacteraceae bacterium]
MSALAAVTGGTGFLGRYIVTALAAAGWRVRILARRPQTHPQLAGVPLEIVSGDLSDRSALATLVDGADVVIHAAGLIKARSSDAFRAVNTEGTATLAAAVSSINPRARVLLVSSLAAREPQLSAYAESKRAAEERLRAILGSRTDWTIVRPCVIYGPWDRETLVVFRAAALRVVPRPRLAGARVALIHATDAATAIVTLAAQGRTGSVLEITDERFDGYTWNEILSAAQTALDRKLLAVPVPAPLLKAAAALNAAAAWMLNRPPMLTPGKIREMLHADWGSTLARQPPRELWRPAIGLARGLRDTLSWYGDRHLLPGHIMRPGARASSSN